MQIIHKIYLFFVISIVFILHPLYINFSAISELAELREGELDASAFYKETFGITPEQALKNAEKLRQMEEMVASLEAEVCLY